MMKIKIRTMPPRWIPLLPKLLSGAACGMLLYTWSVFIRPLYVEFAWSRADIAAAFSICCLVFGLTACVSEHLYSRFGIRSVFTAGNVILSMGFFLTGFVHSHLQLYVTYGLIAGFGGGIIYMAPILTVFRWPHDRSVKASFILLTAGLGLGAFVMAPIAAWLMIIPDYGWRYAFWYCGAAMGLMAFISGIFLLYCSKDGMSESQETTLPETVQSLPRAILTFVGKETARDPGLRLFYAAYFFHLLACLMVIGHMADLAINQGLNAIAAAGAVSILALTNAAARFLSGYFIEKIGMKVYVASLFALQAGGMVFLYPAGGSQVALYIIAALIGWNYGGMIKILSAVRIKDDRVAEQKGICGFLFILWALAGCTGPWIGGYLKDFTGDYYLSFICGAILCAAGGLIIAAMKIPPQVPAEKVLH